MSLPTVDEILNDPKFPATRGELEAHLLEIIEESIGTMNTGNGYMADALFAVIDHLNGCIE